MNPANYHPLREILKNQIDFDTLSRSDKIKLFVCASNVTISKRSAGARQPRSSSVSCESLCASNGFCRVFYDSWV